MSHLKPAVEYDRFSDQKQFGNHSLELQHEAILRAAEVHGYQIVARFTDEGVSAYRRRASQRQGMKDMVDYVLQNDTEAVFFYDESRITRQVTDFVLEVWEEIGRGKPDVKFFSASQGDDREWDPEDLQTQLRLVLASEESAVKSRRALDSQRMMLNSPHPKRPGARSPYGFDMIDGILYPNHDAAIVYFMFFLASWGYADEQISHVLNEAMVPSPGGGTWNASSVNLILNHKAHLGHLPWNVRKSAGNSARKPDQQISLFEDVHEAVVPPSLWEMVHGLRRLKKERGLKFRTSNILDGIAMCKSCGVLVKPKDQSPSGAKGRYIKYQCPACGNKVSAEELHKVVLARVAQDWTGRKLTMNFEKHAKTLLYKWLKLLDAEKESLLEAKERATYELQKGDLPNDLVRSFQIALNHVNERMRNIQVLEKRIMALQDDPAFIKSFGRFESGVFEQLSDVEKRAFLMAVVESVKITFGSTIRIVLEYRLSPYVGLEDQIGQITESEDSLMGKKPKVQ